MVSRSRSSLALFCVVALALLTTAECVPQSQIPSESSQTATQALTNALNAMGGSSSWSKIADATVTGSCTTLPDEGQSAEPSEPFQWITEGNEFRYQAGNSSDLSVLLSGHGKPLDSATSNTINLTSETATLLKPFHLPGQVLSAVLSDSMYSATIVGQETVLGVPTVHVHVIHRLYHTSEPGSDQDWWLSSSNYLPVKVMYLVPGQAIQSYMPETYSFAGWAAEPIGIAVPLQLTISTGIGFPTQSCTASQVQFNTQPAANIFDAR